MNATIHNLEDISKCCIKMLLKEPHYAHILMKLPKEWSTETSTASLAVSEKLLLKLVINPNYWKQLNETQGYNLLKEKALHFLFKHPLRQRDFLNTKLYQLASKIFLSPYFLEENTATPNYDFSSIANLAEYFAIEFLPKQKLDYYYQQLAKIVKKLSTSSSTSPTIPDDLLPIQQRLEEALSGGLTYPTWTMFAEFDHSRQQVLKYQFDHLIQQTIQQLKYKNKDQQLPEAFLLALKEDAGKEKATVNWKRVLQVFSNSSAKTSLKNTIRRPSKRYGTSPGFKIKKKQKILVAVDTSGSIQAQDLHRFFREIHQIWRQGAEVQIVECDNKVRAQYAYNGQVPQIIHGRTGTNFTEAIKFANTQDRLDAIIYFTDGHGTKPDCLPKRPLLWVISSKGISSNTKAWHSLPGRKIKISE